MKRLLIVFFICLLNLNTSAVSPDLEFTIITDKMLNNEVAIKNELLTTYQKIVQGIKENDQYLTIVSNLDLFKIDNTKIELNQNNIKVIIGNGDGYAINGSFKNDLCKVNINKRSLFLEWFSKYLSKIKEFMLK